MPIDPSDSPTFLFSIPGTEETRELTRQEALDAITRGEIEPTQLVWSPAQQEWKPVAEIPELQPAAEAEAVAPAMPHVPTPAEVMARLAREAANKPPEQVIAYAAVETPARPAKKKPKRSNVVEEEKTFSYFKLAVFLLAVAVLAVVAANFVLIDQPLEMNLAKTPFGTAPVHAHLGAFVQPNMLVIHVLPSSNITKANLADLLVAIAASTPPQLFNNSTYQSVGLTPSWVSQFTMSGEDWKKLGQMTDAGAEERKAFILDHFRTATAEPSPADAKNVDAAEKAKTEEKAWQDFAANFVQG